MAFALLLWLGVPGELHAQAGRIRFDHISLNQGLSQSTITCILQDSRGFMWFGTQDGLNRFDGYVFAVYKNDPADPASLPHNYVRAISEDEEGNLWIATDGGGVAKWDRQTDSFLPDPFGAESPASFAGLRVGSLQRDRTGSLWVGTFEAGLSRLDLTTGSLATYRHDPSDPGSLGDDRVAALFVDRAGTLWVGTETALNSFDPLTNTFVHYTHERTEPSSANVDHIRSIFEDASGGLWLGTFDGLSRLDRATATLVRYRNDPADRWSLAGRRVYAMIEDDEGEVWIGTDAGLTKFDRVAESLVGYQNDPADATSLSHNIVLSLYQDRGGILWIGTQGGGINKWNPATSLFRHYKTEPGNPKGLSNDSISSISQDSMGALWIGTLGGGLNRLDRPAGAYAHYRSDPEDPDSLNNDWVMSLVHDRDDVLWIGTRDGGVNRFDPATGTFKIYKNEPDNPTSLSSNGVMSLFLDRQATLWIGTYGGGLNRFDRASETFTSFRPDPADSTSLSDDRITAIAEDADGRLWVGTERGGLNRLDRATGTFVRYQHDPADPSSLSDDVVLSLYADDSSVLWVGTLGGGLNRLDLEEESATGRAVFRRYSERDGLPNDAIYGIEPDDAGGLWLSTNNGLARLDPLTETFDVYDMSHGLQSSEFNFGAHHKGKNGEIFFGGFNGFNAFYPARISGNTHVPPVVFTSFTAFNNPVELDKHISEIDEIELSYRDHVFAFEVAALDYTASRDNQYAYKLEGFDDDWIDLGSHRRLTFTGIDPGSYVLRVRGSNNDGLWNDVGASLVIRIIPPIWATWWAYGFYGLLIAGAIAGYVKVQNDKLRRKEANRRRLHHAQKMEALGQLAGGVAHDFNNLLTGILGNVDFAIGALDANEKPRRGDLEVIKECGQRAATLTRQLLAFSRQQTLEPQVVNINEVMESLTKLLPSLVTEKIEISTLLDPDTGHIRADPGQIEQVIVNLALNARDAMPEGGTLTVETRNVHLDENYDHGLWETRPGDYVLLAVSDTGSGIDAEALPHIFEPFFTTKKDGKGTGLGLATIHGIVKQNKGSIELESKLGDGTVFKIYLPRVAEPPDAAAEQPAEDTESGTETLLVVEDEQGPRRVALRILHERGYNVLLARDGEEAMRLSHEHDGRIDLVVTDVAMPRMGGAKLAEQLRELHPQIKVLYMSGYTDTLSRKVREVLDGDTLMDRQRGDREAA